MSAHADIPLRKNYRLVYDIVCEQAAAGGHVVMGEVFALARQRQPHIGLATVYRALARLERLQLVDEVHLPGAQGAFFEPSGAAHAHFRCDRCGSVADVDYTVPPHVTTRIERQLGAEIGRASVSLHGRCARCRELERGPGET
jgi:Fur family ferric uptake transcriptional regulator